ncbi:MAG: hypothetical protein ABJN65_15855 [Parasphingorhabdus sp.]
MKILHLLTSIALPLGLSACVPSDEPKPETSPQDIFFERISILCDKAYEGELVSDEAVDADFVEKPMIMHVSKCEQNKIEIPFHVAAEGEEWNRSRTWILTRTTEGIRLKHRHKHEDGSLDAVTNYGGDTEKSGTENRQEFPVDAESITSFEANDLAASVENTWAVEISPPGQSNAKFAYELRRPKGPSERFFRVEFDLSQPVTVPPPPWGN